jgi:hypothetical protein
VLLRRIISRHSGHHSGHHGHPWHHSRHPWHHHRHSRHAEHGLVHHHHLLLCYEKDEDAVSEISAERTEKLLLLLKTGLLGPCERSNRAAGYHKLTLLLLVASGGVLAHFVSVKIASSGT